MIMQRREHLTTSGLQEIINLRASLNLGLSDKLKAAFPKTIPANKPKVENQIIPHPQSQLVSVMTHLNIYRLNLLNILEMSN